MPPPASPRSPLLSREFLLQFLVQVLLLGGACAAVLWGVLALRARDSLEKVQEIERARVERRASQLVVALDRAAADLRLAARLVEADLAEGSDPEDVPERIASRFAVLMAENPRCDHLRLLGLDGREQVRVNNRAEGPTRVPEAELQHKGHRDYFLDAVYGASDRLSVSHLDLNIERGAIERPLKPTLRFASPVFDPDGRRVGAVMLNYRMGPLLDEIVRAAHADGAELGLVNADGFWLRAPRRGLEWGHLLPERNGVSFAQMHPNAWGQIRGQSHGQLVDESGLYVFAGVTPRPGGATPADAPSWTLVSHFPPDTLRAAVGTPERDRNAVAAVVAALVLVISALLAQARRRASEHRRQLERSARYDALTNLPNRTLLYDRLRAALQTAVENRELMAVLMIDLDGFKDVNDSHGHSAGDQLLRVVAQRLRGMLRAADHVARVGGDEFTIVLSNLRHPRAAKTVAKKCLEVLRAPYRLESHSGGIGASIGIAVFPGDGHNPEELLGAADAAMYAAKRDGKNTCMRFSTLMMSSFRTWEVTPPGGVSLAEIHSPSGVDIAHEPDPDAGDRALTDHDRATTPPSARSMARFRRQA